MSNYLNARKDFWNGDLFDTFFSDSMFRDNKHLMRTDIKEDENGYDLEIEMPGFNKENINLSLNDGYLTIEAEIKQKENSEDENHYIRRERFYGSVKRSYYVGKDVTEEDIKAQYNDGILSINVPKVQPKEKVSKLIKID